MKSKIFILLLLVTGCLSAQALKVMTYNIRYDKVEDTINNWNDRKAALVELIKHYNADIVGTQEVLHHQLTYIDSSLTDYAYIGVARTDGKQKGEYSPIYYNQSKYNVLKNSTFWLSETPEKPSKGWDASLNRVCTYGLFQEKESSTKFYVFNTHFDHRGTIAREKSIQLIIQKIKALNTKNLPVILMGDLNLAPTESPIQYLRTQITDAQLVTQKPFYGPTGTFNSFDPNRVINKRIDYIFIQNFNVLNYHHIDDRMENNKHISDHLPVLATLSTNQ